MQREERGRESRDRDDERGGLDPRDVFMRDLDLPDGRERELVHDRDREYTFNGSDTRALSTIGAFRVVPERDLNDPRDATFEARDDLRHLEKQGLIERVPLDGRDRAAVLTDRGRSLLESHGRDRHDDRGQAFYAGADRARERTHDAQLYRAYLKEAERQVKRQGPRFVVPMAATLVAALPAGVEWLYEAKFDGYRAIALKDGATVKILSRKGNDLTHSYPSVQKAVAAFPAKSAVLDGEIVAFDQEGRPSFQQLQHRTAKGTAIGYFVFDLLH